MLPSGEVIQCGGKIVKVSTGYDLTQLVIGSEGTLALVTKAYLKLYPRAPHQATVLAPFTSLEAVTAAVPEIVRSGVGPLILEYIDMLTMAAATAYVGLDLGIPEVVKETALAYLVVGLESTHAERLEVDTQAVAEQLAELGAMDVYVLPPGAAAGLIDAREKAFWVAKANGADDIIDVVVPRAAVPAFMARVSEIATEHGAWIAGCGHAGDGNVHMARVPAGPAGAPPHLARAVRGRHGAGWGHLGRARARHREGGLLPRARGPGQDRPHAAHQGRLRPERHPQPRHDLRLTRPAARTTTEPAAPPVSRQPELPHVATTEPEHPR